MRTQCTRQVVPAFRALSSCMAVRRYNTDPMKRRCAARICAAAALPHPVGAEEHGAEEAAVDGRLVEHDAVLLVVARVAGDGHDRVVPCRQLPKVQVLHGARRDQRLLQHPETQHAVDSPRFLTGRKHVTLSAAGVTPSQQQLSPEGSTARTPACPCALGSSSCTCLHHRIRAVNTR